MVYEHKQKQDGAIIKTYVLPFVQVLVIVMNSLHLKKLFEALDQLEHGFSNYHLVLLDQVEDRHIAQWRHRILGSLQFQYKESFNQDIW